MSDPTRQEFLKETRRSAFVVGLPMYIGSFFLIATGPSPHQGWNDAAMALVLPINELMKPPNVEPLVSRVSLVAIAVSGLINGVFVLTTILGVIARAHTAFKRLRIVVLLMMPFPWLVFRLEDLNPREGYFVWTLGMLLVLFSDRLGYPQTSHRGRLV